MARSDRFSASITPPIATAAILVVLPLILTGCSQSSQTPLPELTRIPRPLMDAEAQKRAIRELEAERAKLKAEAEKLLNRVE